MRPLTLDGAGKAVVVAMVLPKEISFASRFQQPVQASRDGFRGGHRAQHLYASGRCPRFRPLCRASRARRRLLCRHGMMWYLSLQAQVGDPGLKIAGEEDVGLDVVDVARPGSDRAEPAGCQGPGRPKLESTVPRALLTRLGMQKKTKPRCQVRRDQAGNGKTYYLAFGTKAQRLGPAMLSYQTMLECLVFGTR